MTHAPCGHAPAAPAHTRVKPLNNHRTRGLNQAGGLSLAREDGSKQRVCSSGRAAHPFLHALLRPPPLLTFQPRNLPLDRTRNLVRPQLRALPNVLLRRDAPRQGRARLRLPDLAGLDLQAELLLLPGLFLAVDPGVDARHRRALFRLLELLAVGVLGRVGDLAHVRDRLLGLVQTHNHGLELLLQVVLRGL